MHSALSVRGIEISDLQSFPTTCGNRYSRQLLRGSTRIRGRVLVIHETDLCLKRLPEFTRVCECVWVGGPVVGGCLIMFLSARYYNKKSMLIIIEHLCHRHVSLYTENPTV